MGQMLTITAELSPAHLAVFGPGQLDRENPLGVLIFDAGRFSFRSEPIEHFYSVDAPELEWLRDYFVGMDVEEIIGEEPSFEDLAKPPHEEEEVYSKSELTTTASDPGWDS